MKALQVIITQCFKEKHTLDIRPSNSLVIYLSIVFAGAGQCVALIQQSIHFFSTFLKPHDLRRLHIEMIWEILTATL